MRLRYIFNTLVAGLGIYVGTFLTMPAWGYKQDQAENVVITRGGNITRVDTTPGIGLKWPIIDSANRFTTRLVDYRSKPQEGLTADKKTIRINFYAMYRIADPELFIEKVRPPTTERAQSIIDDFVYAAMRNLISSEYELKDLLGELGEDKIPKVDKIPKLVKDGVAPQLRESAGIEIIDVRLTETNPTQNVLGAVYDRMKAERNQKAQLELSEGERHKIQIIADADREVARLRGEAYATAQKTKGEADAEALKTIQKAYSKDPEFAFFLRELALLRETTGFGDELIISTDSDLYKLMKSKDKK